MTDAELDGSFEGLKRKRNDYWDDDNVSMYSAKPRKKQTVEFGVQTLDAAELADKMPIQDRQCVDCCWCLVFLMTVVVLVGIAGYGVFYGNATLITTLWDSDSNACGLSTLTADKPYLYFPKIPLVDALVNGQANSDGDKSAKTLDIVEIMKYGVCVDQCPMKVDSAINCYETANVKADPLIKACTDYIEVGAGGTKFKVPFKYDTSLFFGKLCIPSVATIAELSEDVQLVI